MLDLEPLRKVERDCFIAVLKHLVTSDQHFMPYYDLAQTTFAGIAKPFVPMALEMLVTRKYLQANVDHDGKVESWSLHPNILADAFEFVEGGYTLPVTAAIPVTTVLAAWDKDLAPAVPAADRFVPINHNSEAYREAGEALEQLAHELTGNNELFANADERLAVVREVQSIREAIGERAIRVTSVLAITSNSGTLSWLTTEVFSGTIRTLAAKAIDFFIKHVWPGTG